METGVAALVQHCQGNKLKMQTFLLVAILRLLEEDTCLSTLLLLYYAEHFWRQMPYGKTPPIIDDQASINYCLDHMGFQWTNYKRTEGIKGRSKDILGQVPLGGGGENSLSVVHVDVGHHCLQTHV